MQIYQFGDRLQLYRLESANNPSMRTEDPIRHSSRHDLKGRFSEH
jgi:hypothetical protein